MVLERAGLVRRKIRGRSHLCQIEPSPWRRWEGDREELGQNVRRFGGGAGL